MKVQIGSKFGIGRTNRTHGHPGHRWIRDQLAGAAGAQVATHEPPSRRS